MAEIDVGSPAINRASSTGLYSLGTYGTRIDYNNPSNASGTLDTVEVWFSEAHIGNSVKVGTFVDNGDGNFTCHDAESIGTIPPGSKQTVSGLEIDISAGEYIGADARTEITTTIERDTTGYSGMYYATGQYCDPSDSADFTLATGDAISLYGTGEEIAPPAAGMPWNLAPRMAMMMGSH